MDRQLFGMALRQARRSIGLTQRELARGSGTSERAIRNTEQGSVLARTTTLELVIAELGRHGADVAPVRAALRVVWGAVAA